MFGSRAVAPPEAQAMSIGSGERAPTSRGSVSHIVTSERARGLRVSAAFIGRRVSPAPNPTSPAKAVAEPRPRAHFGLSLNSRNQPAEPRHGTRSMAAYERADSDPRSITDLLLQLRGDHTEAMHQLFPLVYEELRRMA